MLDPECKDHQLNDNVQIGLVKPVHMMCGEVNKSDDKLDKTLDVGVIVDCVTFQSSPPPNVMDYQDPQPTDKGSFGFDDMLDPGSKDLVKLVDMMCGEDNISNDRLDDTVAGGVIVDRSALQSIHLQMLWNIKNLNQLTSFDDKMDPRCKDQPLNDNVPKGLVKLDDTMSGEDSISDYKWDETVVGGVIVHRATLQKPHQTNKVDAAVFVDVQLGRVQSLKNPSLIDNVEVSFIILFK
nr:hypothetical protein [Tanacetum cinerariifolium]